MEKTLILLSLTSKEIIQLMEGKPIVVPLLIKDNISKDTNICIFNIEYLTSLKTQLQEYGLSNFNNK